MQSKRWGEGERAHFARNGEKMEKTEMIEQNEDERLNSIPVVPLRGLVVLPYSAMSFDVGREMSITAVNVATMRNDLVFLAAQKDASKTEVGEGDIEPIGCLCRVKGKENIEGGTIRVLVEAVSRGWIERLVQDSYFTGANKFLAADIVLDPKEAVSEGTKAAALREEIEHRALGFAELLDNAKLTTTLKFVGKASDEAEYTYRTANILLQKPEDRQKILNIDDHNERSLELLHILAREQEVLELRRRIDEAVHEALEKNQREYILREQIKAAQKELGADEQSEAEEFREKLNSRSYPDDIREKLDKEITRFASLPAGSHESPSMRTYIETMLDLPYTEMSEDNLDVENARRILDEDHYGLEKVKERIIEYIAVARLTGKVNGQIICFVGPPGVGKTSVSASIARALGRRFVRMSLGGIRDEAEIRGHRRTYIGAMPGRIINAMKQAGTVNPVLLFDEIDKLAQDIHGDPSAAMLEVLDSAQNFAFRDHFLEVPYDLSKVMFITTANNAAAIPRPLLDRMEVIEVPSYLANEKVEIAARHLIPRQMEKHGLSKSMLRIPKDSISEIINSYTREAGVRNLERKIAAVCRKAACDIAEGKKRVTVSVKKLHEYLGAPQYSFEHAEKTPEVGVVTGLAWTSVGGETLEIEVAALKGSGHLQLTGQLGEVMQESAKAAITCIRERTQQLGLEEGFFEKTDVHIHIPEGAVPKDGPSAGVSLMTAVASALTGIPVRAALAMTGEITLRGRVLPIGGLREKLLAAVRAGITTVLVPEKNRKDVAEVPKDITDALNIVFVNDVDEVLRHALVKMPERRLVMPQTPVSAGAPA